jgi:hypothetical protein
MARDHRDDVVRLATADTPAQAHIWQQALQDEGIESHVVGDYLDAGLGDVPGMRAELWVHQAQAAQAQAILQQHQDKAVARGAFDELQAAARGAFDELQVAWQHYCEYLNPSPAAQEAYDKLRSALEEQLGSREDAEEG